MVAYVMEGLSLQLVPDTGRGRGMRCDELLIL